MRMVKDDSYYLDGIKRSDTVVFSDFFDAYYVNLVMYCGNYIRNLQECEDIVVAVFQNVWEMRLGLRVDRSLKHYLMRSVRNRALNELRHFKVKDEHVNRVLAESVLESNDVENYIFYGDLKRNYDKIVEKLPADLKKTLRMFMDEDMKTREISEKLSVTQRTVELRLNKAFAIIRNSINLMASAIFMIKFLE